MPEEKTSETDIARLRRAERRSSFINVMLVLTGLIVSGLSIFQYVIDHRDFVVREYTQKIFLEQNNRLNEIIKKQQKELEYLREEVNKLKGNTDNAPMPGKTRFMSPNYSRSLLFKVDYAPQTTTGKVGQNEIDNGIFSNQGVQRIRNITFSLIYVSLIISLFLCVGTALLTSDRDRRDTATDFAKTILAFLIGALTGKGP